LANKARDLILAVIDGTPYENGKLKPAVRELDEYIEGLETKYEHAVAAKVEAIEACIETVEARIKTAKACRYDASYIAGMEDILVFHKASLERVRRGEDFHSTSELMAVPDLCKICQHSKHGGVECGVSTEPIGDRCPCEGP